MKHKQQGKKKFIRFFLIRFGVLLTAASCAGVWQTYQFMKTQNNADDSDYGFSYDSAEYLQQQLNNNERVYSDEEVKRILSAFSNTSAYNLSPGKERYLMLFQPETGKVLLSEPRVQVISSRHTSNDVITARYYISDPDIVRSLNDHIDCYSFYYNSPPVYSIYVKGEDVQLGEVYLPERNLFRGVVNNFFRRFSDNEISNNNYHIQGEWVDYSPENTEGWEKITAFHSKESLEWFFPSSIDDRRDEDENVEYLYDDYWGYFEITGPCDAVHLRPLMEQLTEEISERWKLQNDDVLERRKELINDLKFAEAQPFTEELAEDWGVETKEEYLEMLQEHIDSCTLRNMTLLPQQIMTEIIHSPTEDLKSQDDETTLTEDSYYHVDNSVNYIKLNGEKWGLYHFEYLDPWTLLGQYELVSVIIFAIKAVIMCIIIALIWSLIQYHFYSKKYDIDTYRRNLTSALAHDLKTPLAAISGYAENLREHTHPEKADSYAESIMQSVQHMDEVIVGSLELTKLEDIRRPKKELLDITAILHDAFTSLEDGIQSRGLKLTESGKLLAFGSPYLIRQLCNNLASNVLHHAADGGQVTVSVKDNQLTISNPYTGELDVKTLFEPFRRGDEARGRHSGSGLGLSIVKQIASLHKWKLKISAADGIYTVRMRIRMSDTCHPNHQPLDLTAILHDAFKSRNEEIQARGLKLTESGTFRNRGNAEFVRKLFDQLAENAVKYSKEGGTVKIIASRHMLTVSNPYTAKPDIKALRNSMRNKTGSGLGMMRIIAKKHGWFLKISAKDGIFTVTLKTGGLYV